MYNLNIRDLPNLFILFNNESNKDKIEFLFEY